MEKSEELHKEMRKLELDLLDIEARKAGLVGDPEVRTVVLDLLVAEKIGGNDSLVAGLRAEIEGKKKAFEKEERELRTKINDHSKQLIALTALPIQKGVEKLHREIADLKLERKVIDRTSGGFSMVPRVVIVTNEDGIGAAKKIVRDATKILNRMRHEPVSKIQSFVEEEFKKIRTVDLTSKRKEIEEFEYARKEFISSPVAQ